MAKKIHLLSARRVETLTAKGMHSDGAGLYLRISDGKYSGRRWVLIYKRPGDKKRVELGLGSATTVTLAKAREKARACHDLLAAGQDPREAKKEGTPAPTFGAIADAHIEAMEAGWRNDKHRAQWKMTLGDNYCGKLRRKPVDQITTADVLEVLKPIWQEKPETASRIRGRLEAILDAAKVQRYRTGENPAAWRGHLKLILPPRQKLTRGHHAAMAIDTVPVFMASLRSRPAVAARCLEFLILAAARSGEALGARWDEIDLDAKIWAIPAERMKSAREHRVPLTPRAIEILDEMRPLRDGEFVFPGQRRGKPLSVTALEMALRRMKAENVTVHGFRSSFRDWAGNRTSYPRELAEHALAHVIGDKAEQAYRREDALERRRPMMDAWAAFCAAPPKGNVVMLRWSGDAA